MMKRLSRRSFVRDVSLASAAFAVPNILRAAGSRKFIWADLVHLGFNMWQDVDTALRCEDAAWMEYTTHARDVGFNMIVIDLGEGIVYPSHPELAIKGSWSVDKLKKELARLRKMGLEPIPKLNFSACHDAWLGPYGRMVSSERYYQVVADLIGDVCELFGRPRFFHVGMDEETAAVQAKYEYVVCRQGKLWLNDLDFYRREIEKHGARAWMWGDPSWSNPEFPKNVSRNILQSNWYYWTDIDTWAEKAKEPRPVDEKKPVDAEVVEGRLSQLRAFRELDEAGYDQIPCTTNFFKTQNMADMVAYCDKTISPERLLGYCFATWRETTLKERTKQKTDELFALSEKIIKSH